MDATAFEPERSRLTAIATRILGSRTDADDVLQEAQLRLMRTDEIDDLPAWLTTVVTRLCLDHLRKRTTRTEYETRTADDIVAIDPEADALLAARVSDAMDVVLDTLAPTERAAFVLHDVFGYAFEEISQVLGRSTTAVRQIASRARRKVQGQPEPAVERAASADSQRVAFVFHIADGLVREVKLIADPEVLATMDITRLTNTDFGALADS